MNSIDTDLIVLEILQRFDEHSASVIRYIDRSKQGCRGASRVHRDMCNSKIMRQQMTVRAYHGDCVSIVGRLDVHYIDAVRVVEMSMLSSKTLSAPTSCRVD